MRGREGPRALCAICCDGRDALGCSVDEVPEMRFSVVQLRHVATGADYVHVDCADVNNLFRCVRAYVHACVRMCVPSVLLRPPCAMQPELPDDAH